MLFGEVVYITAEYTNFLLFEFQNRENEFTIETITTTRGTDKVTSCCKTCKSVCAKNSLAVNCDYQFGGYTNF